ncbi:MAG TPA: DUF1697 domain-containing protein [Acidobacteriota bacterium]
MRCAAFLRGINVGGNRKIDMADLKKFFEKLKYENVTTILNSGNVIFETNESSIKKITDTLEAGLTKQFKYPARVIVYNISNVEKVIQGYPFDSNETDNQHYVVFLSSDIGNELLKAATIDKKLEEVAVGDGVMYWKVAKGSTLKSNFGMLIAKAKYKDHNTVRNINTLRKIVR